MMNYGLRRGGNGVAGRLRLSDPRQPVATTSFTIFAALLAEGLVAALSIDASKTVDADDAREGRKALASQRSIGDAQAGASPTQVRSIGWSGITCAAVAVAQVSGQF